MSTEGHCYLHYGDIHTSTKSYIDLPAAHVNIPKLQIPLGRVPPSALLADGDVVFVDASEDDEGTSKHVVVANPEGRPFIAGLHTLVAKPRTDELDLLFLRYCFQTAEVKAQFRFYAVGTKVSGVSKGNIGKIELRFPPADEQRAIARVLTDMDAEIAALDTKVAKARALKQGMSEALLTGRIRLVEPSGTAAGGCRGAAGSAWRRCSSRHPEFSLSRAGFQDNRAVHRRQIVDLCVFFAHYPRSVGSRFEIFRVMPQLVHHPLRLLNPAFASPLLDALTELEHLRRLQLNPTTPEPVFLQLKRVFHLLESLASARIEGNHTTLAEYVDEKVAGDASKDEQIREIRNLEEAMSYVEGALQPGDPITLQLIRELHQIAVQNLGREGDRTPGAWRSAPVQIAQAEHLPPDAVEVPAYMQELVEFINRADAAKYDLMKVALAHHRFAWIHPFGNGNGRVVRLLTYALLIKYGFKVAEGGRLLNPAAVFCTDRQKYYDMLALADQGSDAALESWCTYVLEGVLEEIRKLDELTDYEKLTARILWPAIHYAAERKWITAEEEDVLGLTAKMGVVKSGDLAAAMPKLNDIQRTYQIKKLVARGMLQPIREGARQYVIGFTRNELLRGVVRALTQVGLIPPPVSAPAAAK